MSLEYIREYYRVPANIGQRIRYTSPDSEPRTGTIVGAQGPHIKIKMDGSNLVLPYHPTWQIEYLDVSQ